MTRFIIDTNVVVSGLLTSDEFAPTARIVDGMLTREFPFILSAELLREYWEVLRRPAIRRLHGLDDREIEKVLTAMTANGIVREPVESNAAPDAGDQHLWNLLASLSDAILVTGDRRLLQKRREYSVITPAAMRELVNRR